MKHVTLASFSSAKTAPALFNLATLSVQVTLRILQTGTPVTPVAALASQYQQLRPAVLWENVSSSSILLLLYECHDKVSTVDRRTYSPGSFQHLRLHPLLHTVTKSISLVQNVLFINSESSASKTDLQKTKQK